MMTDRDAYQKNNTLPLILTGLLLVVFLGVGFMAARFLFSWTRARISDAGVIPGVSASTETSEHVERRLGQVIPTWVSNDRVTILVLGIDERQQESGPFRTDTIMLVTLDPTTLQAGVLSIPRDLWVPIPGYAEDGNRINTAHFLGDLYDHPGGGPALAMETVQYNFGVPVDYYVRLNFQGFIKLVDLVGGVDIDVEQTLHDTAYPTSDYGIEVLHIEAGPHHFDGEMALKYARTRHGTGDFDRARRQQQVMVALLERVTSLQMLPQLARKAPQIFTTLEESVSTDMQLDEILALSGLALQVNREEIRFGVIDTSCTQNWITPQGAQVLIPLRDRMREVRDYVFGTVDNLGEEVTPADEQATLSVRNGTVRPGLATEVSEQLKAQGLDVREASNADRQDYAESVIILYRPKPITAEKIRAVLNLPASAVVNGADPSSVYDIIVILGADYQQ
ncbi:MAG: LCP family protein [Chloroflexota bacterium]|nr:LCP family protein [Chloroflexota bacterium]